MPVANDIPTIAETLLSLRARIAELETENAGLRGENAGLSVTARHMEQRALIIEKIATGMTATLAEQDWMKGQCPCCGSMPLHPRDFERMRVDKAVAEFRCAEVAEIIDGIDTNSHSSMTQRIGDIRVKVAPFFKPRTS